MFFSLILPAYFILTGFLAEPLLVRLFHFKKTWRTAILGVFLSFSFVGFFAGIFVVFYKLNLSAIGGAFALNILLIAALRWLAKAQGGVASNYPAVKAELAAPTGAWWGVLFYLALAGYGFYLLYNSQSNASLLTPWQTIDRLYIYVFALATLLLGSLIFSRLPAAVVLVLCVINALLLHGYLPFTHELFYGADQWRHAAAERRILDERPLEPAKLNAPAGTLDARYSLNSSGLSIGALAYGSFWGASALIIRLADIDLIALNKWLVLILWSLLLPILLFEAGEAFGWSARASLFLVWLGFLPFTWQALGGLTLPVSFGFPFWLLSVLLLLKRIQRPARRQLPALLAFGLLSLFGYTLYFILFWVGWALAEAIIISDARHPIPRWLAGGALVLAAAVIPAVELVTRYSAINFGLDWLGRVRQLAGDMTAWHLAAGPQIRDITTGNIIFNQPPSVAFVVNFFTVWRWWLVVFMVLFLAAAVLGIVFCLKKPDRRYQWLAVFGGGLFLSYFISRYLLTGENIFARRLDPVLAFFLLFFAASALVALNFFSLKKRFIFPVIVLLTSAVAASYSLGPDTGAVSAGEYAAMQYVWGREKNNPAHCVIAGTYPLLALEALSGREIVGGGFPISQYFAQPELAALYNNFSASASDWQTALRLTGAERCAYAGPFVSLGVIPEKRFGKVGVWWYPK